MGLLHRKSRWEKAIEPVTGHLDAKALARSGITVAVSALSLTVGSAVLSSLRRRGQR